MQAFHFFLPMRHFFQIVITGFFAFFVVLFTEHKHHHIRVLFNRTRFPQVRQLWAFIIAIFHLTRQLGQGNHRDIQFLGNCLHPLGDFGNFVYTAIFGRGGADQLQVVDDQYI